MFMRTQTDRRNVHNYTSWDSGALKTDFFVENPISKSSKCPQSPQLQSKFEKYFQTLSNFSFLTRRQENSVKFNVRTLTILYPSYPVLFPTFVLSPRQQQFFSLPFFTSHCLFQEGFLSIIWVDKLEVVSQLLVFPVLRLSSPVLM